uniref:Putative secreted protein n=1 Tax=Ixodes ricinus TaxID=34613 RepID=A0A6B0TTQ3_IXORI
MTIMFANFPVIFMLTQLHFFSGVFHKELTIQPLLTHQDKLRLSMNSESHECAETFFWLFRKMLLSKVSA